MIWFTSDTHYFHSAILGFKNKEGELIRGKVFSSMEEMNEVLAENWNKVVKKGDTVYHLGDVFFGKKDNFIPYWKRLNGNKRLIVGNHDDAKFFARNELVPKLMVQKLIKEYNLYLTHIPVDKDSLFRREGGRYINVHGHLHHNPSPTDYHFNVCVEQTNYTPISIVELVETVKDRDIYL